MSKLEVKALSKKTDLNKMGLLEIYQTKVNGVIPENHIGLILPNDNINTESTLALNPRIINNDDLENLELIFRHVNPMYKSTYNEGDIIAKIIILKA